MYGCVRWHCPAFPEELSVYAPYSENQSIQFIDERDSTISLVAKSIQKTKAQKLEYGCKCTCEKPAYSMILEYAPNNALYFVIDVPFVDNSMFTDDIDMSRTEYILSSCQFESFYMYYGAPYYTISDHVTYDKLITDDTLLFTKKVDSIFLDSIRIVKNLGVTSFRTADGRRFHLDQ